IRTLGSSVLMNGFLRPCWMAGGRRCLPVASRRTPSSSAASCWSVFSGSRVNFPWQWRPAEIDDFLADLRSGEKPISLKTLRSYSNAVAMFCSYLTHPGYGWGEFCERTFGDIPSQISFQWNTPRHTADDAVPAKKR